MTQRISLLTILILFSVFYLLAFPFAFFRHDDFMMIGNTLHVDQDWKFVFSYQLDYGSMESWFFRPVFKALFHVLYKSFGFVHYPFLLVSLIATALALWVGYRIVLACTAREENAFLFASLFASALPLHFGSVMWAGEGLMNCPQVLLLALSTYLSLRWASATRSSHQFAYLGTAILCYVLALGTKESSVFHFAFMFAMVLTEKPFRIISRKRQTLILGSFAIPTAIYLVYRLGFIPLISGYWPDTFGLPMLKQCLGLLSALLIAPATVVLTLIVSAQTHRFSSFTVFRQKWLYLPFLLVSLTPYVGHGFFSPGWLLLPGYFFVLVFCLGDLGLESKRGLVAIPALITLAISLVVVGRQLDSIGWWWWQKPQRKALEIVRSCPRGRIKGVIVYECVNPDYPNSHFNRVIGGSQSIVPLWRRIHGESLSSFRPAGCREPTATEKSRADLLLLSFTFPKLTWLNPSICPTTATAGGTIANP